MQYQIISPLWLPISMQIFMIATSAKDVLLHRLVEKVINRCDILIFLMKHITRILVISNFHLDLLIMINGNVKCSICYEWGMFILFWAKNEIAIKETFLYIMTLAIIYWKMAVIFKVAFVIYASLFAETLQWPLTCPFRTYIYQYLPLLTLWLSSFRKYVL